MGLLLVEILPGVFFGVPHHYPPNTSRTPSLLSAIMMNMFKALLSLALCGSGAALDIDYFFGAE